MPEAGDAAAETTETTTATTTETTTEQAPDLTAEVEKWKALSKKNEDRAKANAKAATELEQLRQSAMSDQEKAVAQARAEGLAQGITAGAARIVDAEMKAAAKGRVADIDALLEGLDRSKFMTDDGEADVDAIGKWVDRLAPAQEDEQQQQSPFVDIGQGVRNQGPQAQALGSDPLTETLKRMVGR